jgi:hypothetical protein
MDEKIKLVKEIEVLVQKKQAKEYELAAIKRQIMLLKQKLYGKV